jgi:tRNA G18 (ribose-2'-O)-methylase SpoU
VWVEPIARLDDPRVAEYRNVPDPELLRAHGVFVAEGRQVVRTLLTASPLSTKSVLVSPAALEGLRDVLERRDDVPVYLADPHHLTAIVGFDVHRGCLAIGQRPPARPYEEVIESAGRSRLLVVAERVSNVDNIGGLFRNAAAFGAGAVLLSPGCCDPLYRKAIRVSIGTSLRVPFGVIDRWPQGLTLLKRAGFSVLALTPDGSAPDLVEWAARAPWPERIALLLGHEGDGLSEAAMAAADVRVRLTMQPGIDSLNVATAAGIAMYVCAARQRGVDQP